MFKQEIFQLPGLRQHCAPSNYVFHLLFAVKIFSAKEYRKNARNIKTAFLI